MCCGDWQQPLCLQLWPPCIQDRGQSSASETQYTQLRWLGRKQAGSSVQQVLVAAMVAVVTGAISDDSQVDLKAMP